MSFKMRTATPDFSDKNYYSNNNIFYASGYGMNAPQNGGNCTAYAYGRLLENGKKYTKLTGNAGQWFNQAKIAGYPTGDKPINGSIVVWPSHVAVVEDANKRFVSDSGWNDYYFKFYKIPADWCRNGVKPLGFIYLEPVINPDVTVNNIKVGDKVKLKAGANYYDGRKPASFVYNRTYTIKSFAGNRVVITYLGIVVGAVHILDLERVK